MAGAGPLAPTTQPMLGLLSSALPASTAARRPWTAQLAPRPAPASGMPGTACRAAADALPMPESSEPRHPMLHGHDSWGLFKAPDGQVIAWFACTHTHMQVVGCCMSGPACRDLHGAPADVRRPMHCVAAL